MEIISGRKAAVSYTHLVLNGLEKAPHFEALYCGSAIVPVAADRLNGTDLLKGAEGYTYLYRLNCGGDAYTETYGQVWAQEDVYKRQEFIALR